MYCLVGRGNVAGLLYHASGAVAGCNGVTTASTAMNTNRATLHHFARNQQQSASPIGEKEVNLVDNEKQLLFSHQLKSQQFLPTVYNLDDTDNIISYKTYCLPTEDKALLQFKSSLPQNSDEETTPPKKSNLDEVAYNLSYELQNIFVGQMDWKLYHPNIVFEDRIRGKRIVGLLEYAKFINLVKLIAHIKFVYVRFDILNISKHPEDSTIRIRWRIAGLGTLRMVWRYFPDKLWRRGNMNKKAPTWYDGYSVFHIGPDDMIYKHVADRRMPDQDKEKVGVNPVVEKLKKLKPVQAPTPAI